MKYWNETPVLAAGYLRLSRDDGDKLESDSIRSQRSLIEEFVNHHSEITWVGEYVDDGYSGTNFERPAFKRMMEDVKNKKVNCIMVKDLSRFGRNYIETGRYLEKLFPILGVRFIAINDSYDSAQQKDDVEQILVPFKNLLNDAYCRDISIKIRSQLEVKRKNGQFIGSFASYGYEKDPEDKNHLIVDEHAAETIRLIFNLKVEGRSSWHIAARLNELGIPAPMEYKKQQGLKFDNGRAGEERGGWRPGAVDRILRNELYTGTMVQGKSRKINYKVKKCRKLEPADWIRVPNTHNEIISEELFEEVQKLLQMDVRTAPGRSCVYLFSGLLRCGGCGQNMVRRTAGKAGKKYRYYHCSTYKKGEGCSSHIIGADRLEDTIWNAVRQRISDVGRMEKHLEETRWSPEGLRASPARQRRTDGLAEEIEHYQELRVKLRRDMDRGVVDREEYQEIDQSFLDKIRKAKEERAALERKRQRLVENSRKPGDWMDVFRQFGQAEKLERRMLVLLVERIVVHGKDQVELCFRYEDEYQEMRQILSDNRQTGETKG